MIRADILTTTRAEYGLLTPLIKKMLCDDYFDTRLIVTGAHLSEKHGLTYREIEEDGFHIHKKIEILSDRNDEVGVSETMSNALSRFALHFKEDRPDLLIVDGDRYETAAICLAAVNARIPIVHIGGGDTTEGAADECYRHSISKMALLHFPTNETYRKRIIQMGESPERVLSVGSLSIEKILNTNFIDKEVLGKQIGLKLNKPFAVATFHPVTLENNTGEQQILALLDACALFNDMQFIFTKANADAGGDKINEIIEKFVTSHDNMICVSSLGSLRYFSALHEAEFVIGNSSSGITEAPSLHLPTINIGDRQKGRIQAESTINCEPVKSDIINAIKEARSANMKSLCKTVVNPNGDGKTSSKIIQYMKNYIDNNELSVKKSFYNLNIQ